VATIEDKSRTVLQQWKEDIQNGSYTFLEELSKQHSKNFRLVLKDLVDFSFEKDRHTIRKLLEFGWHLYTIEQFAVFYSALFNQMTVNDALEVPEIFLLAYGIKQQMEILLESDKAKFVRMKHDLPAAVRKFVWDEVCLQSAEITQFLGVEMKDNGSKAEIVMSDECWLWKFETVNGGESFHMRSVKLGKYFYETDGEDDEDGGYSMSETMVDGKDWFIEGFRSENQVLLKQKNGTNTGKYWKIV
jgi:hypothetical protein